MPRQPDPTNNGSRAERQLRREWRETPGVERRPVGRDRATFHLPAELLDQVRNAVVALSGPPLRLTMSKFAENAFRLELERLGRQRPSKARGAPFPKRQGEVTRGRPIG